MLDLKSSPSLPVPLCLSALSVHSVVWFQFPSGISTFVYLRMYLRIAAYEQARSAELSEPYVYT